MIHASEAVAAVTCVAPPLVRHQVRQQSFVWLCGPLPCAYQQQPRRGISIDGSVRQLCDCHAGRRQRAKRVIVVIDQLRGGIRIGGRRVGHRRRRVDGNGHALRVLRAQLQRRDDECSRRFRLVHAIGVQHALIFHRGRRRRAGCHYRRHGRAYLRVSQHRGRGRSGSSLGRHRNRSARGRPGAHDGHCSRHFDLKNSRVAIGGEVGERKPARGKQQVSAVLADESHSRAFVGFAHAAGKWAAIFENQRDFAPPRNRVRRASRAISGGRCRPDHRSPVFRSVANRIHAQILIQLDVHYSRRTSLAAKSTLACAFMTWPMASSDARTS